MERPSWQGAAREVATVALDDRIDVGEEQNSVFVDRAVHDRELTGKGDKDA